MYSMNDFYRDWRFRIEQDFVKPSGHPFDYAPSGLREWGDEELKISFPLDVDPRRPKIAAISHDRQYVAVAVGLAIRVVDVADSDHTYLLQGHVSEVDYIAFLPGSSTQLVSVAMDYFALSRPADAQIIFWDLAEHMPTKSMTPLALERLTRNAANSIVADMKLTVDSVQVSADDQKTLAKSLEDPILKLLADKFIPDNTKIFGRLSNSFQSQIFNRSGNLMIYMPGNRPRSNGVDDWELRIWDVDQQEDATIMSGHTDSIVWTSFNHDGNLVGSASWDGTFRVWDTATGVAIHVWTTGAQNWTGEFSPDSKYFAGTSGDGRLHVYNLTTGSQILSHQLGSAWYRALSWHPAGQMLAVGSMMLGKLFTINVETGNVQQHRTLSLEASKMPENWKQSIGSFLEVGVVRFVDNGRKVAFFTGGDGSAEVYDVEKHLKWRFARAGTMNPPDDDSEVKSKAGFQMIIAEDSTSQKIVLGSVDADAVRFWSIPIES